MHAFDKLAVGLWGRVRRAVSLRAGEAHGAARRLRILEEPQGIYEVESDLPPLDREDKHGSHSKNVPAYDARSSLYQLTRMDVVAISGLHASTVQTRPSEIGLDLRQWSNANAFCAWLGLVPRHEISGGNVRRQRTLKTCTRAGQALRLAAQSVSRCHHSLGAFYRRMQARRGPKSAIVASAHKLARIVYHLLTPHMPFRDLSAEAYEPWAWAREITHWREKAASAA